jgi:L-fuconolactonase
MKILTAKQVPIDYLVNCTQLVAFLRVFDAVPGVCAVLDHGARPFVMTGDTRGWEQDIKDLARNTDCYCKLSGLAERAGVEWNTETLKPWVAILLETFGPERLIFASNWPIMSLMATPQIWLDCLISIFDELGVNADDRGLIFQGNAGNIYLGE